MCYLQGLDQLLPPGDVGDVDGGAEGVQHLHLLQHVLAAGGADDQQLAALRTMETHTDSSPRCHVPASSRDLNDPSDPH